MSRRLKTTRLPPTLCPVCGGLGTRARSAARARVRPRDFSVCMYCTAILRFDAEMHVQRVTPDELAEACAEQPGLAAELAIAQESVRVFRRTHPLRPDTKQ